MAKVWDEAMEEAGADAVIVPAGSSTLHFQDDQAPAFRANPNFAHWVPENHVEHSVLVYRPGAKPRLLFYQPADYWHMPPSVPDWAPDAFDLETFDDLEALTVAVVGHAASANHVAYIGAAENVDHNLPVASVNPAPLVNRLHYARAYKNAFELDNIRIATEMGARGHRAACDAFFAGASEFDIHLAFLKASQQVEAELPYQSIVAQNEHAGVLHYQLYDREAPAQRYSFLIDAGGRHLGYASDITRTYSAAGAPDTDPAQADEFGALIAALDEKQLALIARIRPGVSYVDLHESMHVEVAELLHRFGFVTCSAEAAFESGITDAFFPHGLGHLLGLQTHDVGGQFAGDDGHLSPPPGRYPALRLTRVVEPRQVFTIEPGIYFIPLLLNALRASAHAADVNWSKIEAFLPYGGIRIEDNVHVTEDSAENLTRAAFERLG